MDLVMTGNLLNISKVDSRIALISHHKRRTQVLIWGTLRGMAGLDRDHLHAGGLAAVGTGGGVWPHRPGQSHAKAEVSGQLCRSKLAKVSGGAVAEVCMLSWPFEPCWCRWQCGGAVMGRHKGGICRHNYPEWCDEER